LETRENAVSVPVDAVLTAGDGAFLFVLEDGKAVRRKVETGFEQDGRVWIRSGLAPGEKLIVGGIERVKDGVPVRLEGGKPARKETGKAAGKAAGKAKPTSAQ
jgi:membrane fusion protein (multidrug efflux system)